MQVVCLFIIGVIMYWFMDLNNSYYNRLTTNKPIDYEKTIEQDIKFNQPYLTCKLIFEML